MSKLLYTVLAIASGVFIYWWSTRFKGLIQSFVYGNGGVYASLLPLVIVAGFIIPFMIIVKAIKEIAK